MRQTYQLEGVVLKSFDYKDADKIYTIFTKERGKISVLAKGVKKITSRRSPHLDTLNHISFSVTDASNFKYLTEVRPLNSFQRIKSDLDTVAQAFYFLDVFNKSTDELLESSLDNFPLFELLLNCLKLLNSKKCASYALLSYFEFNLMHILGYSITLDKCVLTGKSLEEFSGDVFLSYESGGLVSKKTDVWDVKISSQEVYALSALSNGRFVLDTFQYVAIYRLINGFFTRALSANLKPLHLNPLISLSSSIGSLESC